jgi:hypothetical protein
MLNYLLDERSIQILYFSYQAQAYKSHRGRGEKR